MLTHRRSGGLQPPTERIEAIDYRARRAVARIEVELTHEAEDAPRIGQVRYAVLPLATHVVNGQVCGGFVLYDRLFNRIVDGVYRSAEDALWVAGQENHRFGPQGFRCAPTGVALGLLYPDADAGEGAR